MFIYIVIILAIIGMNLRCVSSNGCIRSDCPLERLKSNYKESIMKFHCKSN